MIIFHYLLKFIRVIPTEEILQHWEEAKKIMEHIDSEDVTIIAAALSQNHAIIWSDDKHFDQQRTIPHLKTKEMLEILNYEN
jgi:predicted nucleic acid-binding protein